MNAPAATCTYEVPYTAALEAGNVFGVQFHPEKSGPVGLRIVRNFLDVMLAKRIIPCLDVTGGRVVKGVHFVNLRDAGDPVELAERYNRDGADELVFLDITASSDAREIMADVVARTARKVFIPAGGGRRHPLGGGCAPHSALGRRQGLGQHRGRAAARADHAN